MTAFKVGDRVTLNAKESALCEVVGVVEEVQVAYIVKWPFGVSAHPGVFSEMNLRAAPERRSGEERRQQGQCCCSGGPSHVTFADRRQS